jgi:hypothetical protein
MSWQEDEKTEKEFIARVDAALMELVFEGRIEISVDEEGEFVFWMNDAQKKWFNNSMPENY